jgi:hypothetical protein
MKRKDRVKVRREEAKKRTLKRAERSPEDQLLKLDEYLGPGKGAKRERARLQEQIADEPRMLSAKTMALAKKKQSREEIGRAVEELLLKGIKSPVKR